MTSGPLPLEGTLVLDVARMLPGAVLARMLVDLGARVVKIEDPGGGDPMRHSPPLAEGVGAGFCAFYRGAESVALDLRSPAGAEALRRLSRHADILVESFRPGTLARWGLDPARLSELNPRLVTCSLPGFGARAEEAARVAHDLNVVALSGVLSLLPGEGVPRIQLADVTTGMLACSSILAALLLRHRTHRGLHVEQPLAASPLPFLAWAWAAAAAGGGGIPDTLLAGACPAYRLYRCGDGERIAVGALEPKFWVELLDVVGLAELSGDGLDAGERGRVAVDILSARFAEKPARHWLDMAAARHLPVSPVRSVRAALAEPTYQAWSEETPLSGGGTLRTPSAFLASFAGARPLRPAPRLGEGTVRVLAEFGFSPEEIARQAERR